MKINKIYHKNIKKYYFDKKKGYLNLYDKKTNKIIETVKIPTVIHYKYELEKLSDEIKNCKKVLTRMYIFIKENLNKRETVEPKFNSLKNKYKALLEILTSYNLYDFIVNNYYKNKKIISDNEDQIKSIDQKKYIELYLSMPDINVYNNVYKYNAKDYFKIEESIIDDIYNFNKKQLTLYNKITSTNTKNKKDIIEYLNLKKDKEINNQIFDIKNKETIDYIILS